MPRPMLLFNNYYDRYSFNDVQYYYYYIIIYFPDNDMNMRIKLFLLSMSIFMRISKKNLNLYYFTYKVNTLYSILWSK